MIQEEAQLKIEEQNLNLDMQLGQPTLVPTSIVICAPTVVKQEHYHQQIAPHQYQMQIMDHTAQTRSAVISENHGCRASNTQVAATNGVRLVSCNNMGGSSLSLIAAFLFLTRIIAPLWLPRISIRLCLHKEGRRDIRKIGLKKPLF